VSGWLISGDSNSEKVASESAWPQWHRCESELRAEIHSLLQLTVKNTKSFRVQGKRFPAGMPRPNGTIGMCLDSPCGATR
jgi:hypothetical protein